MNLLSEPLPLIAQESSPALRPPTIGSNTLGAKKSSEITLRLTGSTFAFRRLMTKFGLPLANPNRGSHPAEMLPTFRR